MNDGTWPQVPIGIKGTTYNDGAKTHWLFNKVVDDIYIIQSDVAKNYMFEATPDKKVIAA